MNEKHAFVLMPFAEDFSDVFTFLISDALRDAGYIVKRADDIKSQRNVIGDIIEGIANSDLVVADLTGANPNVYYELGVAHGLNRNVILITQDIDELPFDLRSYRVVRYSTHFAKMNQASNELSDLAREAANGTLLFGNPVKDFGSANPNSGVAKTIFYPNVSESSAEDLGLLDFRVMLEDSLHKLQCIVTEVGDKLRDEVTPEITKTGKKLSSGQLDTKQQRKLIRELAEHLRRYSTFVVPINHDYRLLLKDFETSLENILGGHFQITKKEEEKGLKTFINALTALEQSAVEGRQGLVFLIKTMEALPKIEREFNRAKVFMVTELRTFVDNIDQTIAIIARSVRLAG